MKNKNESGIGKFLNNFTHFVSKIPRVAFKRFQEFVTFSNTTITTKTLQTRARKTNQEVMRLKGEDFSSAHS